MLGSELWLQCCFVVNRKILFRRQDDGFEIAVMVRYEEGAVQHDSVISAEIIYEWDLAAQIASKRPKLPLCLGVDATLAFELTKSGTCYLRHTITRSNTPLITAIYLSEDSRRQLSRFLRSHDSRFLPESGPSFGL